MVSTDVLQVSSTPCCNIIVLVILDNDNLLYRFESAKLHIVLIRFSLLLNTNSYRQMSRFYRMYL